MKAILVFRLPEEKFEHGAALLGGDALATLWRINVRCRSLLMHDYMASNEVREFADEIRGMIDDNLLEAS